MASSRHKVEPFSQTRGFNENIDLIKNLGADEVIDYRNDDFTRLREVDLVLNTIGGNILEQSGSVLTPGGRIASLVAFDLTPKSSHTGAFVFFAEATSVQPEAIRLFLDGQLQIIIDTIFTLDHTRAAFEKLSTGHACGKVLI
ncbi:NADPH:quinone reductase-like Zn-dependent oxidoreductase [Pantoea alhagi]|uniref:zinc-binding dehydrogenase n=1 Tax=Mixta sp. BE291 TaxID=3158787 RepID=UPI00285BD5D0|nr:NADPH:quinone reductase-like Zn-dependent oxidoreductase [Pantoea alhagi]